ncbi:unnamed protein product [Auanema sp. JU1783]|nr:unnamed protein product [Auanema sp. JU1783]
MWTKTLLYLVLCYSTCIADPTYCPRAHEVFVDSTSLCYLFQNSLANYNVARRQCQDLGYELVSYHSAYVNQYIASNNKL